MRVLLTIAALLSACCAHAAEVRPLKALLITGGGYHDYQSQKKILTEGVSARANFEWTVVLENPKRGALPQVYAKKDWAAGYDVIVHNECYASYTEAATVERIVQDHVDHRVGAIMIHCAMHTFRDAKTKAWDKLVGVESRRHGPKFPIVVRNLGPRHPVMKQLPATWTTPQGELYHTSILPSAMELGVGFKAEDEAKSRQVCVWANEYQNCRVFGTTLGHHNETMSEEVYLDMLARGMLWSCRKLTDDGRPAEGYGKVSNRRHHPKFEVYLRDGSHRTFAGAGALAAADLDLKPASCCGGRQPAVTAGLVEQH